MEHRLCMLVQSEMHFWHAGCIGPMVVEDNLKHILSHESAGEVSRTTLTLNTSISMASVHVDPDTQIETPIAIQLTERTPPTAKNAGPISTNDPGEQPSSQSPLNLVCRLQRHDASLIARHGHRVAQAPDQLHACYPRYRLLSFLIARRHFLVCFPIYTCLSGIKWYRTPKLPEVAHFYKGTLLILVATKMDLRADNNICLAHRANLKHL
jgi:hypothetical protein